MSWLLHSPVVRNRRRIPQVVPAASGTAGYAVPASLRGIGAQAAGVLGLLTGL
jgi:hypothetical protein